MTQGTPPVLTPPISPQETDGTVFSFAPDCATGLYITAVDSINVTVLSGDDDDPSSRVIGGPVITQRPNEPANSSVEAWFGTMQSGTTYQLQCVVSLSDGRSHPSVEVTLSCK